MEEAIRELERRHQDGLARGLRILDARYKRLRVAVAITITIIALGCAGGIFLVSHESKVRRAGINRTLNAQCWGSYNGRVVLRALVANSANANFDPNRIQNPELRALIQASAKNSEAFKKFAFDLLPLPPCTGENPNPPPKKALKLAGK